MRYYLFKFLFFFSLLLFSVLKANKPKNKNIPEEELKIIFHKYVQKDILTELTHWAIKPWQAESTHRVEKHKKKKKKKKQHREVGKSESIYRRYRRLRGCRTRWRWRGTNVYPRRRQTESWATRRKPRGRKTERNRGDKAALYVLVSAEPLLTSPHPQHEAQEETVARKGGEKWCRRQFCFVGVLWRQQKTTLFINRARGWGYMFGSVAARSHWSSFYLREMPVWGGSHWSLRR